MNPDEDIPQDTTKVKSPIGNTRILDNHYDPKLHEKPWMAAGALKDYKYNYSDSGLAYTMEKPLKMKQFKERHEQIREVEELNRKSKGFRHFKEYDNVTNNEILITIEYCTNCKQHQGSTRHNEEKYAGFANALKRDIITQYPIVKVVLKPLVIEQNDDSTEAAYLRTRLGAFEVQLYSKNDRGEVNRRYIFSKLRTRNWPSVSAVVESISSFLPTADFVVRLVDVNYDPEEIKEESETSGNPPSQRKTQVNKLKGIHVILRPLKTSTSKKIPFGTTDPSSSRGLDSARSRPTTGSAIRPQSGYSSVSGKSVTSTSKSMAGGQENYASNAPPREFMEQTDNFGLVVFKQIPHNVYELEVIENQNYLPEKMVVNIFEMAERGIPLKEEIMLKEQTMGVCRIKLIQNFLPFTGASVIVSKKDPEPHSKTAVLREKDPKSGVYEFMIDPGCYVISVTRAGSSEQREEINVEKGVNDFSIPIKESSNYSSNYESENFRSVEQPPTSKPEEQQEQRPNSRQRPPSSKGRGEPQGLSAAKPTSKGKLEVIPQEKNEASPSGKQKARQQQAQHPEPTHHEEAKPKERVKSAMVKKIELSVLDIDTAKPVIGADVILEEIGFKGSTNDQGKCLIPINKLTNGKLIIDHESYFGMVEDYGDGGIDLKSASEKKLSLIPRPGDIHEIQMRFIPGNGVKCAKLNVLFNHEDEASQKDITIQHLEGGKEVVVLRNLLKKHGVFRIVAEVTNSKEFLHPETMFILSHFGDCDQLYIFPPSNKLLESKTLTWDVGFFADPVANPQFVEINGYSIGEVKMNTYLKEYQMLLNYLHNSKSDLKTLLGFKDKSRVEKEGDILVSKETIYASLDKYGLEIKNLDYLLSSALTPEGLYSFRECERRLASLRPPFNFVKDQGKGGKEEGSEEGEDEEYLFEDEH